MIFMKKNRYNADAFDAIDEYFMNREVDNTVVPKSELRYSAKRIEKTDKLYNYYRFYDASELTRNILERENENGYELLYNPANGKFYFELTQKSLEEIRKFQEEGKRREQEEIKLTQELEKAFGCDIETIYHKLKNVYKETGMELPFDDDDDYEEEVEEVEEQEIERPDYSRMGIVTSTANLERRGTSHRSFFTKNTGTCEILHVRQRED